MNLLIVGSGQGSWQMRGVQLGAALGARVTSAPTDADWAWATCVILVKRAAWRWAARAHARQIPIVWDALDFWRQPADHSWSAPAGLALLRQALAEIRPTLTIGATEAMAEAAGGVCLPHHGRRGLVPTPARDVVHTVAYDGNPAYLAEWAVALRQCCLRRGWTFLVNPPDLAAVDVLVALRGGVWDGWMPREWKSGVKLANAILAGRPVITQPSAAWRELQPAGTAIDALAELPAALDAWTSWDRRQAVVEASTRRASAFTVDAMAARARTILASVDTRAEVA